jgi:hypothetical protein
VVSAVKKGVKAPAEAAGAVARSAKGLSDRLAGAAPDDPFNGPFVMTVLGLLALASALLGGSCSPTSPGSRDSATAAALSLSRDAVQERPVALERGFGCGDQAIFVGQ